MDTRWQNNYIEERNGGYYAVGTRVSLHTLVQCFNDHMSVETLLGEFDTSLRLRCDCTIPSSHKLLY